MSEADERPVMAALRLFTDPVGLNPTGRPRKSSAGQRRKKLRRLSGGEWNPGKGKN